MSPTIHVLLITRCTLKLYSVILDLYFNIRDGLVTLANIALYIYAVIMQGWLCASPVLCRVPTFMEIS